MVMPREAKGLHSQSPVCPFLVRFPRKLLHRCTRPLVTNVHNSIILYEEENRKLNHGIIIEWNLAVEMNKLELNMSTLIIHHVEWKKIAKGHI